MKIAILGGSFNPFHIGHAMLAESIIEEFGYDKVFIIPAGNPPHKRISSGVTAVQRLEMVQAFCDSYPEGCFVAEGCEVERQGISYTIDTVKYLLEKYKGQIEGKPALLMGEEVAAQFDKWHCADEIACLCEIIIFPRMADYNAEQSDQFKNTPSGAYTGDFESKFDPGKFKYKCKLMKNALVPVSSTNIRERISKGLGYRYLVPAPIFDYIRKKGLYK